MTEEYPDDVEAWIELAGILEQSDVQVHQPYSCVLDLAGVGGTQQSFIQGDSTPRPKPLPFFIVIIIIIIIVIIIIIIDTYSAISIKMLDCASHPFTSIKCACWLFSTPLQTKMTDFPTLSYASTDEIPTYLYLKPGKGAHFGRSLPVWAIFIFLD